MEQTGYLPSNCDKINKEDICLLECNNAEVLRIKWANVGNVLVLAAGEMGLDTTTGKFKIGNGTAKWDELPYFDASVNSIATAVATVKGTATTAYDTLGEVEIALTPIVSAGTTGHVLTRTNTGTGYVANIPTIGIDALGDVTIADVAQGHTLQYDAATAQWKNLLKLIFLSVKLSLLVR